MRTTLVEGFWIDERPVTNADFLTFVEATKWVTSAEVTPNLIERRESRRGSSAAGSLVFFPPEGRVDLREPSHWWRFAPGANWRHPYGPRSSIDHLMEHPVVHVDWRDVEAFAHWASADLPTEAEWEFAARGGLADAVFAWGDEIAPGGRQMANFWQGPFPFDNRTANGWKRTSPVGLYPANGYGLFDMIGNVWEWTKDWWSAEPRRFCASGRMAPTVSSQRASFDPNDAAREPRKVLKGGSHLCAANYSQRWRPAARHPGAISASTSHVGFRCVVRSGGPPR